MLIIHYSTCFDVKLITLVYLTLAINLAFKTEELVTPSCVPQSEIWKKLFCSVYWYYIFIWILPTFQFIKTVNFFRITLKMVCFLLHSRVYGRSWFLSSVCILQELIYLCIASSYHISQSKFTESLNTFYNIYLNNNGN